MKNLALCISVLFHPLLMVTYFCLLLFYGIHNTVYDYLTPAETKWRISEMIFLFSFLFPMITLFILFQLKLIRTIVLSNPKDRTIPYVMASMFYFALFYLMMDINIWNSIKLFIVGGGISILLTALINTKFKLSAHMVGIGGLLGVLISVSYLIHFDMTPVYIAVILIAGCVGFARLRLEEHRPSQIYLGFLLGMAVQMILFFSLQKTTFA